VGFAFFKLRKGFLRLLRFSLVSLNHFPLFLVPISRSLKKSANLISSSSDFQGACLTINPLPPLSTDRGWPAPLPPPPDGFRARNLVYQFRVLWFRRPPIGMQRGMSNRFFTPSSPDVFFNTALPIPPGY